jgi:hypothetical protein
MTVEIAKLFAVSAVDSDGVGVVRIRRLAGQGKEFANPAPRDDELPRATVIIRMAHSGYLRVESATDCGALWRGVRFPLDFSFGASCGAGNTSQAGFAGDLGEV